MSDAQRADLLRERRDRRNAIQTEQELLNGLYDGLKKVADRQTNSGHAEIHNNSFDERYQELKRVVEAIEKHEDERQLQRLLYDDMNARLDNK